MSNNTNWLDQLTVTRYNKTHEHETNRIGQQTEYGKIIAARFIPAFTGSTTHYLTDQDSTWRWSGEFNPFYSELATSVMLNEAGHKGFWEK